MFKKFEQMFGEKLLRMSKHQSHKIRKIENEMKLLREDVSGIRFSEKHISVKCLDKISVGMDQIFRLKEEVEGEMRQLEQLKYEIILQKDLLITEEMKKTKQEQEILNQFKAEHQYSGDIQPAQANYQSKGMSNCVGCDRYVGCSDTYDKKHKAIIFHPKYMKTWKQ
eukprot:GFUD01047095.1.p1 GENE.GFUD01047095.1~~GFUD01047095.1.p1  ORF type:complete len:167 (+),score=45.74 GFUD01047095.1:108-608(+)